MWQEELKRSLRTVDDLIGAGLLEPENSGALASVLSRYQFLLPRYYASLIDRSNFHCPIRLQAIPSIEEQRENPLFKPDPLSDRENQPVKRVTHRFHGRVLIHLSSNCSMYCRFCFRKSLLNELKSDLFSGSAEEAFHFVESHPEIEEVIFSGGDPFMVSDEGLRSISLRLKGIQSVERVRFHTRVPVTFPMRVTPELVEALVLTKKKTVGILHFNHPRELTMEAREACRLLMSGGIVLLNQSVLLKGVNNSVKVLSDLSKRLFEFGVHPYYLHQLDRSSGTGGFEVSIEEGKKIYQELRETLSGYLVPRYVQDVVGEGAKRLL